MCVFKPLYVILLLYSCIVVNAVAMWDTQVYAQYIYFYKCACVYIHIQWIIAH